MATDQMVVLVDSLPRMQLAGKRGTHSAWGAEIGGP